MTASQRTIPSNPAFVLAEPFRRLVNEWLDVQNASHNQRGPDGRTCPSDLLCGLVWPSHTLALGKRNLYALLHERHEIHFDIADLIVTKLLGRPELWVTDPELSAIYDKVNLLAIDSVKPTCDEARQEVYEIVRQTFTRCDTNSWRTARQLGLRKSFVDFVIAGPPRVAA